MATGTVKRFGWEKGYGFIQPDISGAADVFVHMTALKRSGLARLQPGDRVSYELVPDKLSGRLVAEHLKLLSRSGS